MNAPRIVLLLNNPFVTDSRSWKLAGSLARRGFGVTVVARPGDGLADREAHDGVEVIRVAQPAPPRFGAPGLPPGGSAASGERPGGPIRTAGRLLRETGGRVAQAARYLWLARRWADAIGAVVPAAEIWQAEGLVTLPVALELRRRRGGRVVYDSRDIHLESARFARLAGPWRWLLARRERAWATSADALVTVSQPYADVLRQTLGRTATIVMNGPLVGPSPVPRDRQLNERLGLAPEVPIVLSLGQVAPGRGIGVLIRAAEMVPQAHVVIAGFGSSYDEYRERAAASPAADRIHVQPGVSPDRIAALSAAADVAAIPIEPTTLNHRLTTPTRLFDAMGVGTPVVASDLPGMAEIVRSTGCGELCRPNDPEDLARAIRTILEAPPARRAAYGEAGLRAVAERYAWDRQVEALLACYAEIGIRTGPA
jgi:glycosyltransferase involved in cell wall biosynthesis